MFRIREEQMTAFSDQRVTAFVTRMLARLRTEFADDVARQRLKEEELEPLIRRGADDAEQYAVVDEQDVELFGECLVLFAPYFDRDPGFPWARRILQRPDLSGTEKMDRIHDHLIFATDKAR